jgi:hypothetical protein
MRLVSCSILAAGALALGVAGPPWSTPQQGTPATPAEIVATYNSLADAILAAKKTEHDLVVAILAGTYRHAEAKVAQAVAKLNAGQGAREEVEAVAAYVAQLGNEGDNAVAAVRKKLLDGGQHHNAVGEAQGVYDSGFVIIAKEMKKTLLDLAQGIGKMAAGATAAGLTAEWDKVKAAWGKVSAGAK